MRATYALRALSSLLPAIFALKSNKLVKKPNGLPPEKYQVGKVIFDD